MPAQISSEQLLAVPPDKLLHQTTIIADDSFLSYFAEKTIKENMQNKLGSHVSKQIYKSQDHLAIRAQLLSQDMFSNSQAHILVIKGNDLKHEPLIKLISETKDIPILFILEKVAPAQKKTKSFLQLVKQTIVVLTKSLSGKKAQIWLSSLAKYHQIQMAPHLIEALCIHLDWDLSSMSQLIERMKHENIRKVQSLDEALPHILTTHQAPVFTLMDKLFNGDVAYCHQFFKTYQQTDIIQKIYWMSIKRLRQYVYLQEKMITHNQNISDLLKSERIWPQMQPQYRKALQLPQKTMQNLYKQFCELEWVLKGRINKDFTQTTINQLTQTCQALSGHRGK